MNVTNNILVSKKYDIGNVMVLTPVYVQRSGEGEDWAEGHRST